MKDGKNFFDQPLENDLKTYDNIRKTETGQGDDYTAGCIVDYPYFRKYYKLITINLNKQQKVDTNPRVIEQINVTGTPTGARGTRMYFIIEEVKEIVLDFSKGTVKVMILFPFNIYKTR